MLFQLTLSKTQAQNLKTHHFVTIGFRSAQHWYKLHSIAQPKKGFSVLPTDNKSNWKWFAQNLSKMSKSERNKQHVFWDEIRRLPNETIKQLTVGIKNLVRNFSSLKTQKNNKNTEILMMTLTTQFKKTAIKKRKSHPWSIRKLDIDFRKLVDKIEQAYFTTKPEKTENLKQQHAANFQTTTLHLDNFQDSDNKLAEKNTPILNI